MVINKDELENLSRIVSMYLEYAEDQAKAPYPDDNGRLGKKIEYFFTV